MTPDYSDVLFLAHGYNCVRKDRDGSGGGVCILIIDLFKICDTDRKIVCYGDLNLPNTDWNQYVAPDHLNIEFLQFVNVFGLKQLCLVPTHLAGGILNLIMYNNDGCISNLDGLKQFNSTCDHFGISFSLLCKLCDQGEQSIKNFRAADYTGIFQCLSKTNFDNLFLNVRSPNEMYEIFYTILLSLIELFVPLHSKNRVNREKTWSNDTKKDNKLLLKTLKR